MSWEPVIGLEVHVELSTATKLFCGCPNEFGSEPNTNICPVCLGLPGSLPVLNEVVVEYAVRLGEALQFEIPQRSIFARKNYFYPDMPKNYQVSQYETPITKDGFLEVEGGPVRIERAHLEEDTGKTTHIGGGGRIHEADHSLVDYNRAGVPLMEVVSRPDIKSAEHARAYVTELRSVLETLRVSDVKMEEGSMRIDANVSVREQGKEEFGTKVEVKNMNSLRSLGRAIEFEIERQINLLEADERVIQETRHWNEEDGQTHGMRSKEEAYDYRYFPEPDLVPVEPTEELRERVRASLPELPTARRERFVRDWEIPESDARVLVSVAPLATFAEEAVLALSGGTPRDIVNWSIGDVLAYCNETGQSAEVLPLAPDGLAELVGLVADSTLSRALAKDVLGEALREGKRPKEIVEARGLTQVSDEGELGAIIDQIIADNPKELQQYREADDDRKKKMRGFFMGKAMAATKGKGNPNLLSKLLDERL